MSAIDSPLLRIPRCTVFGALIAALLASTPDTSPAAQTATQGPTPRTEPRTEPHTESVRHEILGYTDAARAFADAQRALPLVAISPDGHYTATLKPGRQQAESRTFDLIIESSGTQTILAGGLINVGALTWSPSGRMLAICEGTLISVVDTGSGRRHRIFAGPGGPYPGTCRDLGWTEDEMQLSFIQIEHASDAELANPQRVILTLAAEGNRL